MITIWIKFLNEAIDRFFYPEFTDEDGEPLMEEPKETTDNYTANVSAEVGEALVASDSHAVEAVDEADEPEDAETESGEDPDEETEE